MAIASRLCRMPQLLRTCRATPTLTCTQRIQRRSCTTTSDYTPRRAVLYVPGNDERKLAKIPSLAADCVVMDCEDGVALNRKEEARTTITRMLNELEFGVSEACVRINSVDSGLAEDDLNLVMTSERLPQTLMLPKVEESAHLEWFAEKLHKALNGRKLEKSFKLVFFVESATGLLNLKDICKRGTEISEIAMFDMDGIVFGSDDFCADIGASRTKDAKELLYARQCVVTIAKAYRLQAIDLVDIDYKDLVSLKEQSLEGARMGFTGKQCIHPSQIPIVQEAFTPSAERIEWATELLKAWDGHEASGKGAFTFREKMIDMPLVLQARNIVRLAGHMQLAAEK